MQSACNCFCKLPPLPEKGRLGVNPSQSCLELTDVEVYSHGQQLTKIHRSYQDVTLKSVTYFTLKFSDGCDRLAR